MASPSNNKTLSPRQQFQSSVRNLTADDVLRHRRSKSISLKYNPYELQHVASLRVSPLRKSTSRPGTSSSLKQVFDDPDFGTEERNVWSRSPTSKLQGKPTPDFTLYEDTTASPNQHRAPINNLPPLQPQIVVSIESDDRPKTRRGPAGKSAFESILAVPDKQDTEEESTMPGLGKFMEGTMTSRSGAVSSTWSESEYAASSSEAEETDSDATPKATRKRRSGSFDLREFQPPSLTPSAIKRTLFGKREGKKDKQGEKKVQPKQEVETEAKKPKRRLRKSMSKLHFLGEKMKIFGSSSQDLVASNNAKPDEKAIFDERKRKAEAAYAEQFGLKKQRDNNGFPNITSSPEAIEPQELAGNQKYDSSTVRHRAASTRSRRTSTGSIFTDQAPSRQSNISEHDIRKRPSRRELEKENQQLRAMLRESQVAREQALSYTSEPESIPPVPPLKIRRSYLPAARPQSAVEADAITTVKSQNTDEPPVPPLPPQHPDRRVLSNVSNNSNRRLRRESFGIEREIHAKDEENVKTVDNKQSNPLENAPKLAPTPSEQNRPATPRRSMSALPRSVSMIVEEPEHGSDEKKRSLRSRTKAAGKENFAMTATVVVNGRKEEWQWPDDVF